MKNKNKTGSQGPSVLLLTLAALMTLRVAAAEPPTPPTPGAKNGAVVPTEGERAQRLGILESIQRYCSEREPAAAAKLQKAIDQIVAGLSKSQVAGLRQSEDYRLGASSMEQFTAKVDDHNAKRLCKESPADSR
jgi:hypothetical protein